MHLFLRSCGMMLLILISQSLYAVEFSADDIIYQQDYNQDGRMDYIITPPIRWALIDVHTIDTPIPTIQPYSALLKQADGSYVLQQLEDFVVLPEGVTPLTNLSRTYQDFNGDGSADFFLRTGTATGVISYSASGVSPYARLNLTSFVTGGNIVMSVTDANGDGISDIVLKQDDAIIAIAYGSNNNTLTQLNYVLPTNNPSNIIVNLAGQLDVSDLGAATYTLPIDLPPGINGVQPSVNISYSSMSGNGPMGLGWSLAAGGSITRCGTTKEQDNLHDGVDFDANDQFCLEGQRLYMSNGGTYAQAGQTMRTEIESFQKIVPNGAYNGDPASFTVTQTDGSVRIYGGDNTRRVISAQGRVVSYLLAEVRDVNANKVVYSYVIGYASEGVPQLSSITYNGYTVIPLYAERNDKIRGYLAPSTRYAFTRRVNQININYQGRTLYHYDFEYDETDPHLQSSRLRNIVRCTQSDKSFCTAPLTFSYEKESGELTEFNNAYNATPQIDTASQFDINDTHNYKSGDFNADGKTDFVQLASPSVMKLWLSNGDGTFTIKTINAPAGDANLKAPDFHNRDLGSHITYPFYPGDFDGDGDTDLVHLAGDHTMITWLSNGDGSFTLKNTTSDRWVNPAGTDENTGYYNYRVGEFNGDGIADLINFYTNGSVRILFGNGDGIFTQFIAPVTGDNASTNYYRFDQGDFNGDGLTDLVHFVSDGAVIIWLAKGDGNFDIKPGFRPWSTYSISANNYRFVIGDYNGDGKSDMVHLINGNTFHTWYSRGDGTFGGHDGAVAVNTNNTGGYNLASANYHFIPADVNGDGLTDLIHQVDGNGDYLHVWLAKHDGTFVAPTSSTPTNVDANKPAQFQVGDFNGDGKADFVFLFSDLQYKQTKTFPGPTVNSTITKTFAAIGIKSFLSKSPQYHRLNGVTDAFKNESTISYLRTLSSTDYKKIPDGESSTYPAIFIALPFQVVSEVAHTRPQGGMTSTSYDYQGLKLHQRGLGLLGFRNIISYTNNDQPYKQPLPIDGGGSGGSMMVVGSQSVKMTNTRYSQYWQRRAQGMVEDVSVYEKTISGLSAQLCAGTGCSSPFISAKLLSKTSNTIVDKFLGNPTRFFNYNATSIAHQYELNGTLMSSTQTDKTLDDWGNPTRSSTLVTDRQNNNMTYGSIVTNSYYPANTSNWQISLLARQTENRATDQQAPPYQPQDETRTSAFEYDGLGRLLRKIVEPDNPSFKSEETYTYNAQGLVTKSVLTAAGNVLRTSSSAFNTNGNLASRTNALGHRESYFYTEPSFPWLVTAVTGPNGLTTQTQYDNIGRIKQQIGADNVSTTTTWYTCATPNTSFRCDTTADPEYTYRIQQTSGQKPVLTYFDKLGRTVRTQHYVLSSGDGLISTQTTRYNSKGLPHLVSKPRFIGGTVVYQPTEYDNLNRPTQVTDFNGAVTRKSYNGLQTTTTDALGRNFVEMQNALGQILWTQDTNGQRLDYVYDAFGNLVQTTDSAGNQIKSQFDLLGRKIFMHDPDQGEWRYEYDVLGQLIKQTDAMGQVTQMTYDILGRMITRSDAQQITRWSYDQGTQGIGKLSSESIGPIAGLPQQTTSYQYDSLGRSSSVTTTISGGVGAGTYTSSTTYDSFSRPQTQTYPNNGLKLRYQYSLSNGSLWATKDATSNQTYWQPGSRDASGQLITGTLGNSIYRFQIYDANDRLTYLQTHVGNNFPQKWQVQYDAAGNVVQRKDSITGLVENLAYDTLNRLTNSYGASVQDNAVSYDAFGNILNKADVGNYLYGQTCNGVKAGPHAVTQTLNGAYSASYCYDRNGNLTNKTQTNGFNQQVTYTPFNKPAQILQSDGNSTTLEYGSARELLRQTDVKAGVTTTSLYLPGYERVQTGSSITEKFYIGDYAVLTKSGSTSQLHYLLRDNQGSVTTILNADGSVANNLAFDVWGKRRNANGSPATTALTSNTTNRGYTGHKMLDNVGLIHMNGRVYDPVIARFVSADPIIQAPNDLQSYNRYAYVRNNPGSLTDPSGFSWWSKNVTDPWRKARNNQYFRMAVAIGLSIWTGGLAYGAIAPAGACYAGSTIVTASIAAGAAGGATMGASLTAMNGGNFREVISAGIKGGAQGAISGAAFGGVSGYYGDQWSLGRVAANGTAGGISSKVSGGNFNDGLKTSLVTGLLTYSNYKMRQAMIRQSNLNDANLGKESKGFFGDLFGIGGTRRIPNPKYGQKNQLPYLECDGQAGGCQGPLLQKNDVGSHLGFVDYGKGDIADTIVESFAGPHDWLSDQVGMYNKITGNGIYRSGFSGFFYNATSYALIPVASPFSAAGLFDTTPGLAGSYNIGKQYAY
jgi:hypothetical protein